MVSVDTPQSICRFGIARGDITPPVGMYHRMWGAATHDRSIGVHRPLTATAMVFEQIDREPSPDRQHVLLAIDHCVLGTHEIDALVTAVANATGLTGENLTVVCSHTHAAGLLSLDRVSFPGGELIPPYLEKMNDTISALVQSAVDGTQKATIAYASGQCGLAAHRDFWDDDSEQWVCGFNPDGATDDTVLVARVTGDGDRALATMVNYACHPTTLAWDNRKISPDFPGAMRQVVEDATGAPCVFLQGASGELGPREGFVGDLKIADRNGRQLGFAALCALESLPPPNTRYAYSGPVVSGATIGTWRHNAISKDQRDAAGRWGIDRNPIKLNYRTGLPKRSDVENNRNRLLAEEESARAAGDEPRAREVRALVERQTRLLNRLSVLPDGNAFPCEVAMWRIGDAVWIAVQGEPYSLLQRELRQRFPATPLVVATIAGSWAASYFPPAELYDKGIYQESIAVVEPGSLERLIDEIAQRIEQLCQDDS